MKTTIAKPFTLNGKWLDYLALAFWIFLAGLRVRAALDQQDAFPLLLALQSGLMAYLLVRRNDTARQAATIQNLIAWFSAMLPLLIHVESVNVIGKVIAWAGLVLAIWAMAALDRSFGIAPADRGLVASGPYRYIRHPMYAGEILAVLGGTMGNWSAWNIAVLLVLFLTLFLRIRWEERVIEGYSGYAQNVRYRLIPKAW